MSSASLQGLLRNTALVAICLTAISCIQNPDDLEADHQRSESGLVALYTFSENPRNWGDEVIVDRSGDTHLYLTSPDGWSPDDWPFEEPPGDDPDDQADAEEENDAENNEDSEDANNSEEAFANDGAVRWVEGCNCMDFGGGLLRSEDALEVINPIRDSQSFSVELWVQPHHLSQSGPARILAISHEDDRGQRNLVIGQVDTHIQLRIRTEYDDSGRSPGLDGFQTVVDALSTRLEHYVVTFEHGVVNVFRNGERIYVYPLADGDDDNDEEQNGEEENGERPPEADLGNWDRDFQLHLGGEPDFERPWQGRFHLAAIYDRALTDSEVTSHYKAGPDP